ncbi:hypothetical protein PsYK624_167870 [Phanerochaete sordida]|uniref:Uncharacterized protein n=1 Tax=Phanerochaete sordida TaxID=48140 RepID=A0A9P3LP49_9APHY|nr:hypothetical protein PsYK624_167870 [Phanerochaete sordida]
MWQRSSDCVRLLWLLPDEAARLAGRSTSNTAPDALDLNAADVECGGEDVAGTVADDAYAAPLASFAGLCCASPYWLFLGFVLKNNPPGPLLTTVQRRFSGTTM